MTWGAIGGAAVGAVGSYLGGKASQPKAPKYRPWDVYSPFGSVDFDKKGKIIGQNLSPALQQFYNNYLTNAARYAGMATPGAAPVYNGPAWNQTPVDSEGNPMMTTGQEVFDDPNSPFYRPRDGSTMIGWDDPRAQGLAPVGNGLFSGGTLGGLFGGSSSLQDGYNWQTPIGAPGSAGVPNAGLISQLGMFGGMIPQYGSELLASSYLDPAMYNRYAANTEGVIPGLNSTAAEIINAGGFGVPESRTMFGIGEGLLGNNYDSVFSKSLDTMRQAAAPFEERQRNDLQQRLFSQGRLDTTGGVRNTGELYARQGDADLNRITSSLGLAEQLYGRDQSAGLSAMGSGLRGLIEGGSSGASAARGLFGLAGQLNAQDFNTSGAWQDMLFGRAGSRLAQAQGLFGFGQGLEDRNYNMTDRFLAGMFGFGEPLNNMVTQGHGAATGAQVQPNYNPAMDAFGGLLQGFGTSVMQNGWPSFGNNLGVTPAQTQNAIDMTRVAPINVDYGDFDFSKLRGD